MTFDRAAHCRAIASKGGRATGVISRAILNYIWPGFERPGSGRIA